MDIDVTVKLIRSTYQIVSGKTDIEVLIIYKGTEYGVAQPWQVRIDSRECSDKTHEGALLKLLNSLKDELALKVKSTEAEARRLQQALNHLDN